MNLGQMRSRLISLFGADLTSAEADEYINGRYLEFCARSKGVRAELPLATATTDENTYALPSNVVSLFRVDVAGVPHQRLGPMTRINVAASGHSGQILPSDQEAYFPSWSSTGAAQITLSPYPSPGEAITGYAAIRPAPMVDDADEPLVDEEYHRAILRGAQADVLWERDEKLAKSQALDQEFYAKADEYRRHVNSRLSSGPFQIQVQGAHF